MFLPEDLLTKRLTQLSGDATRIRFEADSSSASRFLREKDTREQLLITQLATLLPKIEHDPDWEEKFILVAFLWEWISSLWGIALYHCYLDTTIVKSPNQITKLPACLLPLTCLICNASLGVSRKTYQSYKKGRGKLLCQRCSEYNTANQAFKDAEDIPPYMLPYSKQKARDWKQVTQDAFDIINQLDVLPRAENKDVVFKTVLKTYRFFYSQYIAPDRPYLPRYQVFCHEPVPNTWLDNLFWGLRSEKVVRLRAQDSSSTVEPLSFEVPVQDVYLPSCFSKELDGKILNRDIQLLDLERFLNMGAGLP